MEAWRPEAEGERRPPAVGMRNLLIALGLHLAAFVGFWSYSWICGFFDKDEKIIPIDLTIVVNENLDGNDEEPPPLDDPPPPPPKQKPKPKPKPVVKKPEEPKPLEQMVTNITAKVDKKAEKEEPKKPEKKEEPKKPEEPKKTAKELREERIKNMRKSATNTNKKPVPIKVPNVPSGNGRTDKKILSDEEIRRRLNAGYTPGKFNQLATSEEQLALSLIKKALHSKWDTPPWTAELKPMTLRIWFGPGGRILRTAIEESSGDARADQSIKTAASRAGTVRGLPPAFIEKYSSTGISVGFTVRPQ